MTAAELNALRAERDLLEGRARQVSNETRLHVQCAIVDAFEVAGLRAWIARGTGRVVALGATDTTRYQELECAIERWYAPQVEGALPLFAQEAAA